LIPKSFIGIISFVRHTLVDFFGQKKLTEITPSDIETYKSIRSIKVVNRTVNIELTCCKTMFEKAIIWQYAHKNRNPVKEVKMLKEAPPIVRYLTHKERKDLFAFCPSEIKPVVIMALHTGMRKGEIFNLRWPDVDMDIRLITVRHTKSNRNRHIHISDELYDVMKHLPRNINDSRVFGYVVNFSGAFF